MDIIGQVVGVANAIIHVEIVHLLAHLGAPHATPLTLLGYISDSYVHLQLAPLLHIVLDV